jgi:hypothetical protein
LDSGLSADAVLRLAIVNLRCLQNKATLWLQLSPPDRDLFLLIASLNSWHALDVAFDTIRERLLSEKIVELILRPPGLQKHKGTAINAERARTLQNFDLILMTRRLSPESVVRYGKAVIETFGKEKLVRCLRWLVTHVARELVYLNDVLSSPKQKALTPRAIKLVVGFISILRDLDLEINQEEIAKLKTALGRSSVIAKFPDGELEPLITVLAAFE